MHVESGVRIIPAHNDLVTLLSHELSQFSAEQMKDLIVVLPTQRLGQYLLALLASQHKVFLAPTILTLENFVQKNIASEGRVKHILTSNSEELLLVSLIEQGKFIHLQKGHEHEIREFFSQIAQVELGAKAFVNLRDFLLKDVYRDEAHVGSLLERIDELARLYEDYQLLLAERDAQPLDIFLAACVQRLCQDWLEMSHVPSGLWIYFACFTTVKAYNRKLLKLLASKKNVTLLFSEPPNLLGAENPLQDLLESLLDRAVPTARQNDLALSVDSTRVVASHSVLSETYEAINRVKYYLSHKCPPSRIGLLVTDEKTYGPILTMMLAEESFKANMAIAQAFAKTELGSWLVCFLKFLVSFRNSSGKAVKTIDEKTKFREFLCHPLTQNKIQSLQSPLVLLKMHATLSRYETFAESLLDLELGPVLGQLNEAMDTLLVAVRKNKREPLSVWQDEFTKILSFFKLSPENLDVSKQFPSSDLEAFASFLALFDQWAHCWDSKLSAGDCFIALMDKVQSLDTRSVGFPLEGVQIVNLVEARYVPFEVMIVLGCTEGRFPKGLPNDRLVTDLLKVKLGLPGWQYIEALEDTTFHLLCSQAEYFTFLYSVSPDYGSTCRSRFVEQILCQNRAILEQARSEWMGLGSQTSGFHNPSTVDLIRGDYPSERQKLFEKVSASSLSQLFNCPYQFLLTKLGVRKREDDSSSLWEGRWLHEILESFYTGKLKGESVCEPLPQRLLLKKEEIFNFAISRLSKLTELCLPEEVKDSPFYWHVMHFSWPRFAQHWMKFFDPLGDSFVFELSKSLKEYSLAGTELPFDRKYNLESSLLGTLDSLDHFGHGAVLTDYKRKGVGRQAEVESGLSPQLTLYALALSKNTFKGDEAFLSKCLVGYWSIIEGRWQARAVGEELKAWASEKSLVSKTVPSLHNLVEKLQRMWADSLDRLFDQIQPFAPQTTKACDFCPLPGVCRKEDQVYLEIDHPISPMSNSEISLGAYDDFASTESL